jgi:hypothetical protein
MLALLPFLALASINSLLQSLLYVLVVAFILYVVYWAAAQLGAPAVAQKILGVICLVILLVTVLKVFGLV